MGSEIKIFVIILEFNQKSLEFRCLIFFERKVDIINGFGEWISCFGFIFYSDE